MSDPASTFISNIFSIFGKTQSKIYAVLSALVLSGITILLIPIFRESSIQWHNQIILGTIFSFFLLMTSLVINVITNNMQKNQDAKRLKFVLIENESNWHITKQKDGRVTTQIHVTASVCNISDRPINLLKGRLISPQTVHTVLLSSVLLSSKASPYFSSKHEVPPQAVTLVFDYMVEGDLSPKVKKNKMTIGITDNYGTEHQIEGIIKKI